MRAARCFHPRRLARIIGVASIGAVLIGCAATSHEPAGAQESVSGVWPEAPPRGGAARVGIHQVAPGDTAYSIARRYGGTPDQLRRLNGLDDAYTLHVGQILRLPGGGGSDPLRTSAAPSASATFGASDLAPAGRRVGESPTPMARPVKGAIATPYGADSGAARSAGVDIKAKAGEPVFAAADGEVVFVSDGESPLGSVLLIQHSGGIISIYGRIYAIQVKKGDQVARGQRVARVAAPHAGGDAKLHFALRKDAKPIDPTPFI